MAKTVPGPIEPDKLGRLGRWILATLAYCVLVIVFGGFVSSSLSGDGCGMHWPTCHGSLLPDGTLKSAIEISHRYSSGLLLLLLGGVWAASRRSLPRGHRVRKFLGLAVAFCVAEALLGAVLVKFGWVAQNTSASRVLVTVLHLVNTFGLLAFLALALDASRNPAVPDRGATPSRWALVGGVVALLLLGATGAISSMGDQIFPASSLAAGLGADLDPASHFLVRLRGIHPFVAVSAGLYLATTVSLVTRWLPSAAVRRRGGRFLGLFVAQLALGLTSLLMLAPLPLQMMHLLLSDILWISFVLFAAAAVRAETVRAPSPTEATRERPTVGDYVALTKPRVVSLLLFTTLVAMFLGPDGAPPLWLLAAVAFGGYLMAGAANAINMALEHDLDEAMGRTSGRPTVTRRISPAQAGWFAAVCATVSFATLTAAANVLSAVLALAGLAFYVLVYTIWLKRRTWHNIVIGGAAGAFPPLVGYAAVTGQLSPLAWYLFAVILLWTPVHFWALALLIKDDYARAGVPMLPVVKGERATVVQIALYAGLTALVSVMPFLQREVGLFYLVSTGLLNLWLLAGSLRLMFDPSRTRARGVFKTSMAHLALFFVVVAVDRLTWPQ
jgi:protoheme IX farnesyltransferase